MNQLLLALIAASAMLFLLLKLDIRKVLYFDVLVDIGVSFGLMWAFYGTFSGMASAIVAGAAFSIILYVLKRVIGYKRPIRRGLHISWEINNEQR